MFSSCWDKSCTEISVEHTLHHVKNQDWPKIWHASGCVATLSDSTKEALDVITLAFFSH